MKHESKEVYGIKIVWKRGSLRYEKSAMAGQTQPYEENAAFIR